MSMNSNQYYYQHNPNKLSNNSQVYQPSNSGYDSQMNGGKFGSSKEKCQMPMQTPEN